MSDHKQPTQDQKDFALEIGKDPDKIKCWTCMDGYLYPEYGLAPHSHNESLGNTGFLEREDWPIYFEPDLDADGKPLNIGIYHCPKFGCEYGIKSKDLSQQ